MFLAVFAICAVIFSVNGDTSGHIAFSAAVSADWNYQTNEIVKFYNIYTNFGNAFNRETGIFTAPKTHLYVFHLHALSKPGTGFWFTLYHNDLPLYRAHGQNKDYFSSGGNSIALVVKSGETVYVKAHNPSTVHGGGLNIYATFTGYLI